MTWKMMSNIIPLCFAGSNGDIHEAEQFFASNPLAEQEHRHGAFLLEGHQLEGENNFNLGSGVEDAGLAGEFQDSGGEDAGLTGGSQDARGEDAGLTGGFQGGKFIKLWGSVG